MQEILIQSLGWEDPLKKEMAQFSSFKYLCVSQLLGNKNSAI